jgi:hypothetical protein
MKGKIQKEIVKRAFKSINIGKNRIDKGGIKDRQKRLNLFKLTEKKGFAL